jgi:hypothetical protein
MLITYQVRVSEEGLGKGGWLLADSFPCGQIHLRLSIHEVSRESGTWTPCFRASIFVYGLPRTSDRFTAVRDGRLPSTPYGSIYRKMQDR